ncbi:putative major facilitator superfamily permease-3 [Coleophoma cylindrospora]|uniref:Putative major facilitator superfamily permease-3 n=1 Tax=Coleophoma cylindrospora TaxID=1849047 RepID=A0A3D8RSD6_9HELO|nr:putative major facilitator superfamily permease-3 [Coleophoma cylindrospora]
MPAPANEVEIPPRASKLPVWLRWHEPGTTKQEKRLIAKLDWFLLSYSCLCFFMKQLDSNNVSNAYVSGMKEDLGFGPGNELSWMNTYFNIGQILGGPIANLIITVVRPKHWLPACLLGWSLFVLFLFKCNTAQQFYGLRFCVGLFESAASPGIHYVLGCWYRKSELGRRSALFVISGVLGQMFSGYLQSALFAGMEGKGGMPAWRWLFIFDFILSVPIAIYGIFCFPDTPHTTNAWYLNEWERKRVVERIEEEGRKPVGKMDRTVLKRILTSWQLYAFSLAWIFWSLTCGSYVMQFFGLWLKAEGYSVVNINNIPTILGAVNFVFMLTSGYAADIIGSRVPVTAFVGCCLTFCYIIFAIWDVPSGLKMFAFCLTGCYGCFSPLLYGWVNSTCGGDQQLRAFTLAWMTSIGLALVTPFQLHLFPSSQAPAYAKTHGYGAALAFVVCLTLWCSAGLWYVQKVVAKRELIRAGESDDEANTSVDAGVEVDVHVDSKQ